MAVARAASVVVEIVDMVVAASLQLAVEAWTQRAAFVAFEAEASLDLPEAVRQQLEFEAD